MTTFALRLISPAAPFFFFLLLHHSYLLFSCPKWLVLPGYISEGVLYFTDFISRWSVVEVAGRQLFTSVSLFLLFRPRDFDRIGHLGVIERDKKKSRSAKQKREIAQSVCVCLLFCCVCCAHTHSQTQVLAAGVWRLEVSLTLLAPWNIYPSVDVVSRSVQSGEAE